MSNAAAVTRGEKASSFAVTCNLLSQYLKENGRSLGDLGLAASIGKSNTYRPPTTMSLLPGVDVSGDNTRERVSYRNATKSMDLFPQRSGFSRQAPAAAAEAKKEPEKSQLTIFYGGKVLVFDHFPADKARDLMMLAGRGSSSVKNNSVSPPAPAVASAAATEPKNLSSNFVPAASNPPATVQACPPRPQAIASDLPIARKASLHRFFEKRKDRINAKAPYQVNQVKDSSATPFTTPKVEENQPWLGLKPSLSSESGR